jgi:hypothetical protein
MGLQRGSQAPVKPTVESLGMDVDAQSWQRSGDGDGAIEIAFAGPASAGGTHWVLMRVAGDPVARVLVYDTYEWECFIEGARAGEFDDMASGQQPAAQLAAAG